MAKSPGELTNNARPVARRRYPMNPVQERHPPGAAPWWIRLIIGSSARFVLGTVAAGSGVINHYRGGGPIFSRTARYAPPGARGLRGHDLCLGPAGGPCTQPAVTRLSPPAGCSPRSGVLPVLGWGAASRGLSAAARVPALNVFRGFERGENDPDALHARAGVEISPL